MVYKLTCKNGEVEEMHTGNTKGMSNRGKGKEVILADVGTKNNGEVPIEGQPVDSDEFQFSKMVSAQFSCDRRTFEVIDDKGLNDSHLNFAQVELNQLTHNKSLSENSGPLLAHVDVPVLVTPLNVVSPFNNDSGPSCPPGFGLNSNVPSSSNSQHDVVSADHSIPSPVEEEVGETDDKYGSQYEACAIPASEDDDEAGDVDAKIEKV